MDGHSLNGGLQDLATLALVAAEEIDADRVMAAEDIDIERVTPAEEIDADRVIAWRVRCNNNTASGLKQHTILITRWPSGDDDGDDDDDDQNDDDDHDEYDHNDDDDSDDKYISQRIRLLSRSAVGSVGFDDDDDDDHDYQDDDDHDDNDYQYDDDDQDDGEEDNSDTEDDDDTAIIDKIEPPVKQSCGVSLKARHSRLPGDDKPMPLEYRFSKAKPTYSQNLKLAAIVTNKQFMDLIESEEEREQVLKLWRQLHKLTVIALDPDLKITAVAARD
ncbi:hypothetical protein SAMD00019534_053630 [Acytostelium subglobosum LB1]|uniref:hypothetical protein n=1 Tax=Acytostelium subglobosum LB1 TaxID=1410327 RepID=UPI0006449782|nr:hypothetical protein SAMD00019534_053630 [Acytostelium subglobosum LB1]GAM22188.1 hypothetical protein SAMD00019534_053630 [Acytostelium subglobosum LB1]|eukprot:XP_012755288.1 hypothetical protein SAMD00019534_053630 [Acytostelium subglobosum LB1]